MKEIVLYIRFAVEYAIKNRTLSHVKYFSVWYKDMQSGDTTLGRRLPWMTYDAICFLEKICTKSTRVFEYGSGGSSLFFASRCTHVTSVEHNMEWSGFLKDKINVLQIDNIDLKGICGKEITDFAELNPENCNHFVSKDKNAKGLSFKDYVKSIDNFPTNYFDLVVVDGRARNSCVKRAISHIKKGGFLLVDNSDRKYYLAEFPELNDSTKWEKTEFQGPVFFQHAFSKTSFFKKR